MILETLFPETLPREVILSSDSGNRIQFAWQRANTRPIEHGNGFWKLYLQTDDCNGLYKRCMDAGAEAVMEPQQLEHWPVMGPSAKLLKATWPRSWSPQGETPEVSGPETD